MFKVSELLKAAKGTLICGSKDLSVKGISLDSRRIGKNEAFIALRGVNFDGHNFIADAINKGARCVICEEIKPQTLKTGAVFIRVKDSTKALGNIAAFHRMRFDIPVIAVTGSNGKTTAKEMVSLVLSKEFNVLKNPGTQNNHIGLPQALLRLDGTYDFAVLEIGTNHFGEVGYLARICRPNIGIITNIGPSHLEFLKDLNGVFKEKYSLINKLHPPAVAILNLDDAFLSARARQRNNPYFTLSLRVGRESDFSASGISTQNGRTKFLVNKKYKFTLNTLGRYNIYNALAAIAVARLFAIGYADIAKSLADFDFPKGRLKLLEINKIRFIDDTYNSNPLSLKRALEVLGSFSTQGRKIFVMGDMLELGDEEHSFHREAAKRAAGVCDTLITVGKLSCLAAEAMKGFGFDIKKIFACQSSQEAREVLLSKISPKEKDIILVKGSRAMRMEEVFKI